MVNTFFFQKVKKIKYCEIKSECPSEVNYFISLVENTVSDIAVGIDVKVDGHHLTSLVNATFSEK